MALITSRLTELTNHPAASEKNSVLQMINMARQNSIPLTPPSNKVKPSTGKAASNP